MPQAPAKLMDYQVHHEGQNIGTFSLEELRRRREAGILTGQELVWASGIPAWLPLDLFLQQPSLAAPRPEPPPIPSSGPHGQLNRRRIWAIVAVCAVIFVAGSTFVGVKLYQMASRLGATENTSAKEGLAAAAAPLSIKTNSTTETDVLKQAKRFRERQWLEGYKERGDRKQQDAEAIELIEAWIAKTYPDKSSTNTINVELLGDKLASDSTYDEPLVLTVAALNSIELHEKARRLERALRAFPNSRHKAYPKFFATVSLRNDEPKRAAVLDLSALQLLEESFADGSFIPDDEPQLGEIFVNGWGQDFFYRNGNAVCKIAARFEKSFKWLPLVLQGELHVTQGWEARGGGFADSVTEQGWKQFSTHMQAARSDLTKAWQIRPDLALAPARMVYVSMADEGAEEMRGWFDAAIQAQLDYPQAWSNMRWGLRPRWHGSVEAMLALGVTALNTGRFDTDVPRKLFDSINDLASELNVSPYQLYARSDIWPNLQRMYQGYIADPSQGDLKNGWRSTYSVVAYLAGKYDVARSQLELLQWNPWPANLNGWRVDLSLMPLEVAARTGPAGSQINQAELSRRRGNIVQALQKYSVEIAPTNADERTLKFAAHRAASLAVEQRLQSNDWVHWLPANASDLNWIPLRGKYKRLSDGALEVTSGPEGHMHFSRARVGPTFEVRGEFEVVRSSTKDYQAGIVFGIPDLNGWEWYGFRMKRNEVEGEVVSFAIGWSGQQVSKQAQVNKDRNTFGFRFQNGILHATLNGKEVMRQAEAPRKLYIVPGDILVGLGAFNDMNETVIRYRNVEVRRLAKGADQTANQVTEDGN